MAGQSRNKETRVRNTGESDEGVTPLTVKERIEAESVEPTALGEQLAEELIAVARQYLPPSTAEEQ